MSSSASIPVSGNSVALDTSVAIAVLGDPTHQARYCTGHAMIKNDAELSAMHDRVAALERLLPVLRSTARPEEWSSLSSGYRLEIERMQGEILDYLVEGVPPTVSR